MVTIVTIVTIYLYKSYLSNLGLITIILHDYQVRKIVELIKENQDWRYIAVLATAQDSYGTIG